LVVKDMNMHVHSVFPRRETDSSLAEHLEKFEIARQRQLDAIPTTNLDVVTAAYRASVERILEEVRTARRRLDEGRYGFCIRCADPIAVGHLEQRPWATTCTRCIGRPRW
jgi:RNA polymerase-binding transcription factor DksA